MKKSNLKKEFNNLKKKNKTSTKLSKHEENQLMLSSFGKMDEIKEEVTEKQETRREYICSCGCKVTLEGEIYKRKIKDGYELCSKCAE